MSRRPHRSTQAPAMGGGRPPSERPAKICAACGRPFTWRRKWARDWENVKYCSDRCREGARRTAAPEQP